jgi:hypothetical protein
MTREEAVSFIRNTLGCQCPDDVLCAISRETRDNPDICWLLAGDAEPSLELHSGTILAVSGKLLVVICPDLPKEEIGTVLNGAVRLRDTLGFNRVRLAVHVCSAESKRQMDSFQMPDDRVHLHPLYRN